MTDENLPVSATKNKSNSILDMALSFSEEDFIVNANCKLCNSPLRAEAEAYWESKQRNSNAVVQFLANRGESITNKPVVNHMYEHYVPLLRKIEIKKYANTLIPYINIKNDKMAEIETLRAALTKEFVEIGSTNISSNNMEKRKNTELMLKISDQLVALQDAERRINEDWKPVNIIIEKLNEIIQIEKKNSPPEYQERLARVINTLIEQVEGVQVEKRQ